MSINSVKFNQTYQKQNISFGTNIILSREVEELVNPKRTFNFFNTLITIARETREGRKIDALKKRVQNDGKNFYLIINKWRNGEIIFGEVLNEDGSPLLDKVLPGKNNRVILGLKNLSEKITGIYNNISTAIEQQAKSNENPESKNSPLKPYIDLHC